MELDFQMVLGWLMGWVDRYSVVLLSGRAGSSLFDQNLL